MAMNNQSREPGVVESLLLNAIRDYFFEIFLIAPSLPLVMLLRRNIGYRTLTPWVCILGFFYVSLAAWFSMAGALVKSTNGIGAFILFGISFAYAGLSFYWRRVAWGKIRNGELWHTRSRGVSFLNVLPLPYNMVQRFVEPILAAVVAIVLFSVFPVLALWLFVAALCLLCLEQLIFDRQLNAMLDQYDGIIDGQVSAQIADFYSTEKTGDTPPSIEETAGVSVAVAPELHAAINKRRAQKAAEPLRS
jgi:hypothetical protein